ncbi:MAG: hypothetical protein PGN33_13360 [Methylobacterium radiotolerans]
MTSKKNDTVPTHTPPARSVARGELKRRLMALEAAKTKVAERQNSARELAIRGETAKALAAQLAGLKAQAVATLAEHALNGSGRPPKLSGDGREDLIAKLAEAEALAEAAGPAIEIVQVEIARAHGDFSRANAAVHDVIVPVLEEELAALDREVQAVLEKLIPLETRLAGLRRWAERKSYLAEGEARGPFLRLMNAATEVMAAKRVSPRAPTGETDETVWQVLADRLFTDPDALAVPHAEAA